jgi:small-conductance mechanosensitive channel
MVTYLNETFRDLLPSFFQQPLFGSQLLLSDLVFAACALLVAVAIDFIIKKIIDLVKSDEPKEELDWFDAIVRSLRRPLRALVYIAGLYVALGGIVFRMEDLFNVEAYSHFTIFAQIAAVVAIFLFLFSLIDELQAQWLERGPASRVTQRAVIISFFVRSLKPIAVIMALFIGMKTIEISPALQGPVRTFGGIILILTVAWVLIQTIRSAEKLFYAHYQMDAKENLEARRVYTQIEVLKKIGVAIVVIFTFASILMLFESVRRFGASILASAGVLGIIVGFAAQKVIANIFAGLQIALTQPIRVHDVVVVEGEWGTVEDFTLTHVYIKIWDERRLVLPISYFNENPFENWTRESSQLLGTVYLYLDYMIPVGEIREEVKRICENSEYWDGRSAGLQVTDATDRAVVLRALASAADSSNNWNLRCELREKLIDFIRENYPDSLPQTRILMERKEDERGTEDRGESSHDEKASGGPPEGES